MAVFLPSKGLEGSSLLRIHNMARALRTLGWRTLVVPWRLSLAARYRLIAAAAPDVLVMQGVRHELNSPCLYPGQPIVLDMDDADFHLPHLQDRVRQAVADVDLVLAGSRYVADWSRAAGAGEADVVWTGTPVSGYASPPQSGRPPVLAWAQTRPMTYLREADFLREVLARIAAARPGVRFRLYDRQPGDDPAFATGFIAPGLSVEWVEARKYGDYLASFDDVAVGLAPLSSETPFSRGKSFGKVLAYLDRKVPVIASDACEHGAFFTSKTGVVTNDRNLWVAAAIRLLDDPDLRTEIADAAHDAFRHRLSLDTAARMTDRILRAVVEKNTP